MNIGDAIRHYRKLYNITQSELAELSDINEKYLGRIERSESVPTIDKVEQICVALDIRMIDLLMFNTEKTDTKMTGNRVDDFLFTQEDSSKIFYCNCCGYTFQVINNEIDEIVCPNCGCFYNEENGFIEII